jgi:hypothetical protein
MEVLAWYALEKYVPCTYGDKRNIKRDIMGIFMAKRSGRTAGPNIYMREDREALIDIRRFDLEDYNL